MASRTRVAVWAGVLGLALASGSRPPQPGEVAWAAANVVPTSCNGAFSDGTSINVANPVFLADVPGDQLFCDFHTFAWNQFLYITGGGTQGPLFLSMAPWYNVLQPNNAPPPGPYPGGSTALQGGRLDKQQAGDSDQLVDVAGNVVLYDIRVNQALYEGLVPKLYTPLLYSAACAPANGGSTCTNQIWLPPNGAANNGSLEVKTAWRDFGSPANCPGSVYFCSGRFALVGLHQVQKTLTHGEWIWSSFEHVGNAPDCAKGSDTPIAPTSPAGSAWSFFSPQSAGPSVMNTQTCTVTGPTPQCNANPNNGQGGFNQVNICRTDAIPAGGASPTNCAVKTGKLPNPAANNGGNVACLNATLQPQRSGVWKNYKLIGTLWTRGTMKPTQDFRIQIFQTQQPGLPYVEPVGFQHLANTTMETFLQNGSTGYDPFGTNGTKAGCFLCHNPPTMTFQADLSHLPSKFSDLSAPRVKSF
jgi:hypothetical protein